MVLMPDVHASSPVSLIEAGQLSPALTAQEDLGIQRIPQPRPLTQVLALRVETATSTILRRIVLQVPSEKKVHLRCSSNEEGRQGCWRRQAAWLNGIKSASVKTVWNLKDIFELSNSGETLKKKTTEWLERRNSQTQASM